MNRGFVADQEIGAALTQEARSNHVLRRAALPHARRRRFRLTRHRSVIENALVGVDRFAVVVVDRLLQVVALAGGLDVFGAADGDGVGLPLEKLLDEDARPVWAEPVRDALSGHASVFSSVAADGRVLTVVVTPLSGGADASWAVASCVEAVEGGSLSEDEDGASGALYRAVTRNLPDTAVTVFDRDLRFRMAYGEALALNGWTSEET